MRLSPKGGTSGDLPWPGPWTLDPGGGGASGDLPWAGLTWLDLTSDGFTAVGPELVPSGGRAGASHVAAAAE